MIKEYGGLEKYASKQAMKKHEAKETSKKESTEKGEMGRPSAQKEFDAAMQKEWESRKQGAPGKTKPETRKEAEARESGNSAEDLKAKARKQIQDQEAMKEKIRQNKSNDKASVIKLMRKIVG